MKRFVLFLTLVFLSVGAFAQSRSNWNREAFPPEPPAKVTVSGNLEAVNGRIAVKSGGLTYYVFGIDRLIGFVAGLNDGAQVSLEGYESPLPAAPEYRSLWVSKLSFNGKDYEISSRDHRGPGPGFGRDWAGGRGCQRGWRGRDW